jgi:hypothetical protein
MRTLVVLLMAGCATAEVKQRALLGSGMAVASAGTLVLSGGIFTLTYQPPAEQSYCANEPATRDGCLANGFARFYGVALPMILVGSVATVTGLALTAVGARVKKN